MPSTHRTKVSTAASSTRAGHARLTRPALVAGRLIHDVSLRFEAGTVVSIQGGPGVQALRELTARDEGAGRLGELALVDDSSRVGRLGRTIGVTLLDETAATHVALGYGFPELVAEPDRQRVNHSSVHLDAMIGSKDLEVTGLGPDGHAYPLLRGGRWAAR